MSSPNKALIRIHRTGFYDGMPDVKVYLLDEGMGDYDEPVPLRWYDRKKHKYKFGDHVLDICDENWVLGLWVFMHPTPEKCELLYSPSRNECISEQILTDADRGMLKILNRQKDQLSCDEISSLCSKIAEALDSDLPEELANNIKNIARLLYPKANKEAKDKISPILVLEDL